MSIPKVRNPLLVLLLSVLVFVLLEASIFRSGLYMRVSNPWGYDNTLYYAVRFENERPPSGKKDVLIAGASQIENAFSILDFEKANPESPVKFIRGSAPATDEATWYFTLRSIDPKQDRYAAIVLPLRGYKAQTDGPSRISPRILFPFLSMSYWPELWAGDVETDVRSKLWWMALLPSHYFLLDLHDFIFHPRERLRSLEVVGQSKGEWEYSRYAIKRDQDGAIINTDGNTMEGLSYDKAAAEITTWPANIRQNRIEYIRRFFYSWPESARRMLADRYMAHASYWLGKIADAYKNSPTKLVFVQAPRQPFSLPSRPDLPGLSDLRDKLPRRATIIWIDEKAYAPLEQPRFFYDTNHLNAYGRERFTKQFGDEMLQIVQADGR